jgi:hypothetical protein
MRPPESVLNPASHRHEHACIGQGMPESGRKRDYRPVVGRNHEGGTANMSPGGDVALLNGIMLVRRRAYEECSIDLLFSVFC